MSVGAHKLDAKSSVRKGLAQRLILSCLHKVPAILHGLLGNAHAERLRVTAVQKYLCLENRHLLCDPHGRQTHTPVGVCHSEPEFLIGQVQFHGVPGTPEELQRIKPRYLVQFRSGRNGLVHRFCIIVVVTHLHKLLPV